MSAPFTRIDKQHFGPWALIHRLLRYRRGVCPPARRKRTQPGPGRAPRTTSGAAWPRATLEIRHRLPCGRARPHIGRHFDADCAATDDLEVGLLISNAGGPLPGQFLGLSSDTLFGQVRLDVHTPLQLIHHFVPAMAARGRGGLILVSAMGATSGLPMVATTSAGKSFVESLGRSLHGEFAELGLNTTVLIVGPTDTRVIDMLGLDRGPHADQTAVGGSDRG